MSRMLFFSLVLSTICSRVSTDFIEGDRVRECTHQDRPIRESFTDRLMASEGNKVLFTFEPDCSSLEITCVYLCITIKEPPEKIESYIESNDVFVYRSSSNFIEFEAVIRSFFNYSYTHSLKEVEDLHECILYNEAFYESPGLCLSYLVDYGGSREGELSNGDWCMRNLRFSYEKEVSEETTHRIAFLFDEASEVFMRLDICDVSVISDLPADRDEDVSENMKYNVSPCEQCGTTLWICNTTRNQALVFWCEITLEFNVDASDITYISVSRIVKSLEEPPRLTSTSMGETDTLSTSSPTRMEAETSQFFSTTMGEATSQAPSTRMEVTFPSSTTSFTSNKSGNTKSTSNVTSTVSQRQMKLAFGYTIGIVGVAVLLLALLILAISCLVIKTRRKPSKTDKRKAVNTPTLSNSAAETVINPVYESAENDRCFPMLDGPEDVHNPGYELNTTGVTGKKYEDQQNFSNQTSSSSGLDVPEEIYNPAYETSAEARDNDHMYHYVNSGNKEQMKTTIPQEESQYQYADFQGNENLAELTL